jgi:putative ABC transport system permease protein
MGRLAHDLGYGLRQLRKTPVFTAVAVLTLALGIGANTAIFSIVNGVLLQPLPYPRPERIVQVSVTHAGQLEFADFSAREFDFLKRRSESFSFLAAQHSVGFNLTGGAEAIRVRALRVSSTYFDVFGVQPVLGRAFSPDEDTAGGPNVVVLSYGVWTSQFGADPHLIGKNISLDGAAYSIIGVMPRTFQSIPAADLWTTIGPVDATIGLGYNYTLLGRLKNETPRAQADANLSTVEASFFKEFRPTIVFRPNIFKPSNCASCRSLTLLRPIIGSPSSCFSARLGSYY